MYFVFAHGSPQGGEAAGGTGDIRLRAFIRDKAFRFARALHAGEPWLTVEVLDGLTGDITAIE